MSTERTTQLVTVMTSGRGRSRAPAGRRRALLWIGSALIGLLSFAVVWIGQMLLTQTANEGWLGLQGAVYDRGMTAFAEERARAQKGIGDVVVVAIKESTYKDLGEIPSFLPGVPGTLSYRDHPRAFHSRLLRNLKALGAGPVIFDLVFDADVPALDAPFAEQIRSYGKVILSAAPETTTESSGQGATRTYLMPNPTLLEAAAGVGIAAVQLDKDNTARKFVWWYRGLDPITVEDTEFPALAAAGAAVARGLDPKTLVAKELKANGSFGGKKITWLEYKDPFDPAEAPPSRISYYRLFGSFGSPAGPGSVVNYENLVRTGQDDEGLQRLREQFQGKIVLVGDQTRIGQDIHRVPVISSVKGLGVTQQMPGVEIHAHILQSLLQGTYPQIAPVWMNLVLTLVVCVGVAVLGRVLPPTPLLGVVILLMVVLYQVSLRLLAGPGAQFLEPLTAMGGAALSSALEVGFMYVAERRSREAVRRVLDRHVGPGVAKQLTEDEWPEGAGETCEITMLFSDLQGFTSISETMTSPEICNLLNRYFGVVLPVVHKYGGTLDKLMGDGMMAYFGWRQRRMDHAKSAIQCALEVQEQLEEWQRQPENAGMPPLRTRVGIHSGPATIGEIGAGGRAEFTVIGDVVNVASRLEGMNKEFGTAILISEVTRDRVGNEFPMTHRGVATVRGRTVPMSVYSVDRPSSTARQRTLSRTAGRMRSRQEMSPEQEPTMPQTAPGESLENMETDRQP